MGKRSCTIALGEKEEAKIVRTNKMKPLWKQNAQQNLDLSLN